MKFNKFKTRKSKLTKNISDELLKPNPNIQNILTAVYLYEKDNLDTIDKLKRIRNYDAKKIQGGLKSAINAHGPITKVLIGSACKRILGSVSELKKEIDHFKLLLWFGFSVLIINLILSLIR